jgi:hypothetical protein
MSEIWSKMYIHLHVKFPLFLSDFNKNLIFATHIGQVLSYQISWKSIQWEPSCSMQMDGQTDGRTEGHTDMMKLIVTYHNFVKCLANFVSSHSWDAIFIVCIFTLACNIQIAHDTITISKVKAANVVFCARNVVKISATTPRSILLY